MHLRAIFVSLISLLAGLFPVAVSASEYVVSFHSDITIHRQTAEVEVTEKIVYDFGGAKKHGIIRSIPIYFYTPSGTLITPVEVLDVTDETGSSYTYTTDIFDDTLNIKIGDADVLVTDKKTYRIHYSISGVLNYFTDHDEFYWNVTGNGWDIPIYSASANVKLDTTIPLAGVSSTCFQGYTGETTTCEKNQLLSPNEKQLLGAEFQASPLDPNQGLTIVFGVPAGTIAKVDKLIEPYVEEELGVLGHLQNFFNRPWVFFIPFMVFVYSLVRWIRYGRDPKGRGVIVAQFEAPDKLSPLQVGALIDEKVQTREISAEIVHLAVLGYLTITRIPKTGIFGKDDYTLEKIKDAKDLPDWQESLMKALFGSKKTIKVSDLQYKFVSSYVTIMAEVTESLFDKGYFAEDPTTLRMGYYLRGAGLGLVLALPGALLGWMVVIAGMASGFIYMLMGFAMPKKTVKGVEAREYALGLKLYLSVAEKDRLAFHNAPKMDAKIFERFLPYAMVFRVDDVWAKQFTKLYETEPRWYHDPSQRTFNMVAFTSGLHSFSSYTSGVMTSSRSTHSSSGGSGFSGGSSGGGFGGGGGHSW